MKFRFLTSLILLFCFSCAKQDYKELPLLQYVPENASLIIKINDFQKFKETIKSHSFLADLKSSKVVKEIIQTTSYLNYISSKSEGLLTFTEVGSNNFEFAYITKNSDQLFSLDSVKNKTIETLEFANATFEAYNVDGNIFFTLHSNDKIIISSSKLLLEKLDEKKISTPSETLLKLYDNSTDAKPASIFWRPNKFNALISSALNEKSKLDISGFSDWVSLDFTDDIENIHLSGISIANDSTWNYIDLFANTKPVINNTLRFAPLSADAIVSYTFDDFTAFSKNKELATRNKLPETPDLDAVEEIGIIYSKGQKAVLLNTYGAEIITEYLKNEKKSIIEFQGKEIISLRKTDFINQRFSPIITDFNSQFCAILEDAFIFSETLDFLKVIMSNYKDGKTFNKGLLYESLSEALAKESSMLYLTNGEQIDAFVSQNFSADFTRDIAKLPLSDYGYAAQTITEKNFYHTNLVIQKLKKKPKKNKVSTRFNISLDAKIATDPQFVINHLNRKKEIVVQDEKNILYLISDKGKVLWKKQLSSLIQGKIHQVDLFKNSRLQMAFTTNNKLMVLDRNGTEVRQFTKTFEGGNLNPLAVFDYERKKNYRFVVTQNNKTFMYNNKASIVTGFKYTEAEKPIIAAPKHLVIGNKDYLVFKLRDGTLKLLNRVGDIRTKVTEKFDFSDNEIFVFKNKFTFTDKTGVLYEINDHGSIKKTPLKISNDHGLFTTERTLVTMNDNILTIKDKPIELEMGVYTKPAIFYVYNKVYISITDLQNEKTYLYDSQGKTIPGFPVYGNSKIDLNDVNNDKKIEIVTIEGDSSLILYAIN